MIQNGIITDSDKKQLEWTLHELNSKVWFIDEPEIMQPAEATELRRIDDDPLIS